MMFDCLGYPPDHPDCVDRMGRAPQAPRARRRAELLPALSIAGVGHRARLSRADGGRRRRASNRPSGRRSTGSTASRCWSTVGDWAATRPTVRPGGWAFQYENPYYPDLDDTAAVALALDRFDADALSPGDRSRRRMGASGCRAEMAAGARSTPTTRTTT